MTFILRYSCISGLCVCVWCQYRTLDRVHLLQHSEMGAHLQWSSELVHVVSMHQHSQVSTGFHTLGLNY